MAITNFQPTIWAALLLDTLKNSLVFGAPGVVNRDYEGEITDGGSSVKITDIADPTIGTFTKDTDITIQALSDDTRSLTIDQAKYFAFEVDDLDKVQARNGGALMSQAAVQAAYGLRDVADKYIAAQMKADVLAGNKMGAKAVNSPDSAYKLIVDMRTKLTKSNVPVDGRWVAVTPDFYGYLLQDSRFISVANAGTDDALRNGRVGKAAGVTIYESNNCPAGATSGTMLIAGHPLATSYAEQIVSTEAVRMEKRFADMLKGLHVYGVKVVRPSCLVTADVTVS